MPVIIVGADTPFGMQIAERLSTETAELRAFVSDLDSVAPLRSLGCKVAVGDVSDESHTGAAAHGCFSAILITEAADDERERSFADTAFKVVRGWVAGARDAGVQRIIWVTDGSVNLPDVMAMEVATVHVRDEGALELVATYEDLATLP
jgi:uncharacterized protein YbjT (DUF2867 family)